MQRDTEQSHSRATSHNVRVYVCTCARGFGYCVRLWFFWESPRTIIVNPALDLPCKILVNPTLGVAAPSRLSETRCTDGASDFNAVLKVGIRQRLDALIPQYLDRCISITKTTDVRAPIKKG